MKISDFDYSLPDHRIARFPLPERDSSKLLVWKGGAISETRFGNIGSALPSGSLLIFNNTRVVRARLAMFKSTGARIEVLCLEPHNPTDYERAFAARGSCEWVCMVGNLKKWVGTQAAIQISFDVDGTEHKFLAWRKEPLDNGAEQIVRFEWDADLTFGRLLETLGRIPIPPYLSRDSETIDNIRYQTVYARSEGSVAAPTAGLHFTPELIERLKKNGTDFDEVTLHVGAGTFLPIKTENALEHPMHTEHFEVTLATVEHILSQLTRGKSNGNTTGSKKNTGPVIAVGTTSVRTLESLAALGLRIMNSGGAEKGSPDSERPVGQFELQDVPDDFDGIEALESLAGHMKARRLAKIGASTKIMITPGFRFRIVDGIVTNFHQPKSTLLLLISALVGVDRWREVYDYALSHDFRFLSYGDSSLLLK